MKFCHDIVERSHLIITKVIEMTGVARCKFYDWQKRLGTNNNHNGKIPKSHWLLPQERKAIIDFAGTYITVNSYYLRDGYRRIAYKGIDKNVFASQMAKLSVSTEVLKKNASEPTA